jgi:antagonist of KipI
MDLLAMKMANALAGNALNEAVVEMSFPAASLHFHKAAFIALAGADFSPRLNGAHVPLHQPIGVAAGSELKFSKALQGAWCYLAVRGGVDVREWLGSTSTHVKAGAGGLGRFLKRGDILPIRYSPGLSDTIIYPWRTSPWLVSPQATKEPSSLHAALHIIPGNEFSWLTRKSQKDFLKQPFAIGAHSDRMGYRLIGPGLKQHRKEELLSSAVSFGTIQLLPNGELIALMADHQTTGGYPRIAHVISADRSRLVQGRPGDKISFTLTDIQEAEDLAIDQERSLRQLQWACTFKLRETGL